VSGDKISNLRNTYDQIFKLQIEGHEQVIPMCFHQVLAPLTHIYFYDGKDRRYGRFHTFLVWASGTGKGEVMKLNKDVINAFNSNKDAPKYLVHYASGEINPQALRGGKEERWDPKTKKKDMVMKPGMLKNYVYIAWGEGNALLSSSSSYANAVSLQNLILNITDDPGIVSFAARKDLDFNGVAPEYTTFTNLSAGSTPDIKSINMSLLKRGFLSRFLFDYDPSADDKDKQLSEFIARRSSAPQDYARFHDLVAEFKNEFYSSPYIKEITIPPKVAKEYSIYKLEKQMMGDMSLWDTITTSMYGFKKEILKSYFRRSIINDKRFAAQCAAINGQSEVELEYLIYGAEITKGCINSLGQFLSVHMGGDEHAAQIDENLLIIKLLKHFGSINQSDLINELQRQRALGKWTKGVNASRNVISRLVSEGLLKENKGSRNMIIYEANVS